MAPQQTAYRTPPRIDWLPPTWPGPDEPQAPERAVRPVTVAAPAPQVDELPSALEPFAALTFPVRVLGHSLAPVVPKLRDPWWQEPIKVDPFTLEPIGTRTKLPPRAKRRLNEVLAGGVQPRAIVVFHEIPGEKRPLSLLGRAAIRLHRLAHQELPVLAADSAALTAALAARAKARARTTAPVVGAAALTFARRAAPIIGIVALALLAALGKLATATVAVAAAVVASDPCLVVVTTDGYWVELDRWY